MEFIFEQSSICRNSNNCCSILKSSIPNNLGINIYTDRKIILNPSSLDIPLRVIGMNGLVNKLTNIVEYVSDAIAKIFTPSKDDFPATGEQPYKGDSASESK